MSSHSRIDRESFQTFLANAFAVQESGLDDVSVSALIEIQQFIAGRDFELDGAMRMIADRALKVCSASGVAIALLEGNALVYRSGSGRAAQDVGRRVPAVLSVSSSREMREILRVENAKTDARIEAYVCRQFGAMALLMLPIWKEHVLAGVLQVLFDDAHSFDEREVRTYGLLVGALEYGMLQRVRKPDVAGAVEPPCIRRAEPQHVGLVENVAAQTALIADAGGEFVSQSQPVESVARSLAESEGEMFSDDPTIRDRISHFWWVLTSATRTTLGRLWGTTLWNAGAVACAVIALSVSGWIFHRTHSSNPQIKVSAPTLRDASVGTAVEPPSMVESSSTNDDPKILAVGGDWKETTRSIPGFVRVRVGPNEVDYVSDDVTIREFGIRAPKSRNRSAMKQADFGEDVTVRYFPDAPPVSKSPSSLEVTPTPTTNQDSLQPQ